MEIVNKEAILHGKGGGHDGQANRILSGINFLKENMISQEGKFLGVKENYLQKPKTPGDTIR